MYVDKYWRKDKCREPEMDLWTFILNIKAYAKGNLTDFSKINNLKNRHGIVDNILFFLNKKKQISIIHARRNTELVFYSLYRK